MEQYQTHILTKSEYDDVRLIKLSLKITTLKSDHFSFTIQIILALDI